jgi:hypothetical protein
MFAEKGRLRGDTGIFVVILIVVLIAGLFIAQKWVKSNAPDPDKTMNISPMREWELRKAKPQLMGEFRSEQPKIMKPILYEASLIDSNNEERRGNLRVMISSERMVQGGWSGSYRKNEKVNFDISGMGGVTFQGKVYPGKIYSDGNGQDPARIYFLARGNKFIVQVSDFEKGGVQLMTGNIYVRGWIMPDLSVEGDVVLDRDDNKTERFIWTAIPSHKEF